MREEAVEKRCSTYLPRPTSHEHVGAGAAHNAKVTGDLTDAYAEECNSNTKCGKHAAQTEKFQVN